MNHASLVDYGIQTEQSDIRVHVCPAIRRVYVYPTESGLLVIKTGKYRLAFGYQPGWEEPTAKGYLVPPEDIPHCVEVMFRNIAWDTLKFCKDDSTSVKGGKALRLVKSMLKRGMLPLPAETEIISDKDIQISGTDIIVKSNQLRQDDIRIQVKCDFEGGRKELGGTGNLFLQVKEINPLGMF